METTWYDGVLVLDDGEVFEGEVTDPSAVAVGEVVFNTSWSGYQEIVTDPSYAGQMITFTYPHIGNYGVNDDDFESARPHCRGVLVRDLARRPSNWRSTGDLGSLLARAGVPVMAGIDTRRLTRHLRDTGARPGAFGADETAVRAAAASARATDGTDLVITVTVPGIKPGDIDVQAHGDVLELRGIAPTAGSLACDIGLPVRADMNTIETAYADGTFEVRVPTRTVVETPAVETLTLEKTAVAV